MLQDFATARDALIAKSLAGVTPLESRLARAHGVSAIHVIDDVLPESHAYLAQARALPFHTVSMGPVDFHGIAACPWPDVPVWIATHYPAITPRLSFFRQSPAGQLEPNYIHSDRDMGDWTGIFYLTESPLVGDGTTFWRHRPTNATASTATTEDEFHVEWGTWRQEQDWEPWHHVEARHNRLVLFPAPFFHSRAIRANYGAFGDTARLIQIVFGTGVL